MLRTILWVALPLLLPTLIYFAYAWVERRKAIADGAGVPAPWWVGAPWPWLAVGGVLLMGVTLVGWALVGGNPPGETYRPARVIDGKLVGGQTEPAPSSGH